MPEDAEDDAPSFQHASIGEIPSIDVDGAHVRLIAGTGWGERSPVPGSSPLVLADIALAGADVPIDGDHAELAVLALDGEPTVANQPLARGRLHVLEPSEQRVLGCTGRVLVLGGEPLGRRHIWWNFVHSDPARIEDAKLRWTRQEFAVVPNDHDPYVPLPT